MRFLFSLLIGIGCTQLCIAQELKFAMPLKGVEGKNFFIDYYPDHDTSSGYKDVFCGDKTYNGHKGTDFLLRGYKAMDSGVYIYAAADGRVFETNDGMYDRSKHWIGGGLGNHVGLIHKGEVCTYYGHMMKNSLMVKMGDSVKTGQPIGKVGSSGYSSHPHLHFEARNKDGRAIDPFWGECSPRNFSYWIDQPPNDTSLFVIDDGFVPYKPATDAILDTLQEGYLVTDTFRVDKDSTVCFWALMHGMHEGDVIRAEWYTPKGILKSAYNYEWKHEWKRWHVHTWTYINMPMTKGEWTMKFFINRKLLAIRNFYVVK